MVFIAFIILRIKEKIKLNQIKFWYYITMLYSCWLLNILYSFTPSHSPIIPIIIANYVLCRKSAVLNTLNKGCACCVSTFVRVTLPSFTIELRIFWKYCKNWENRKHYEGIWIVDSVGLRWHLTQRHVGWNIFFFLCDNDSLFKKLHDGMMTEHVSINHHQNYVDSNFGQHMFVHHFSFMS